MFAQTHVQLRRLPSPPDRTTAIGLLREIAGRPCIVAPRRVDKPLAIYGAGAFGKLAKQYCDHLDIPVAFVVDSAAAQYRADPFWAGTRLLAPGEVAAAERRSTLLAICVGKVPYAEVVAPLVVDGWLDIVPFYTISAAYMTRHPLGNGWFAGELSATDLAGIESVLLRYDDDVSRAHHIQFLAWHCLHEEWGFDDAPVCSDNRYFIPELTDTLRDDEVFVDLGAHHGSAAASFLERVGVRFGELWLVEPDCDNLARLLSCIDSYPPETARRIHTLACAIGRENGPKTFFSGLDFASQFCVYGNTSVEVRTLDSLGLRPSFIKAHLEGAEMDAILGGVETIRRHRPLVALTVYHNRLGLWSCQQALMDAFHDCGYRFVFRLHSWHGSGAVLYLINR